MVDYSLTCSSNHVFIEYLISPFLQELRHALPYIIENMFGFGNESGWGIDKIDKHNHPQEFECLRRFLAPDSRLLNLIYRLQGEIYLSYEFPFKYLPVGSLVKIPLFHMFAR